MEKPANMILQGRNPDGTFLPGFSGNPNGRPRNTMKDYLSRKFRAMNDEEKEEWLRLNRIDPDMQVRLAEGNPSNHTDITSGGEPLFSEEHLKKADDAIKSVTGIGDIA